MCPPRATFCLPITPESVDYQIPDGTHIIEIKAQDEDCHISFGYGDVIADQRFGLVTAGERLFFGVRAGSKIAVIGKE